MNDMMRNRVTSLSLAFAGFLSVSIVFLFLVSLPVHSEILVETSVSGDPALPEIVAIELDDIFTDTLTEILFESDEGEVLLASDSSTVAEAIRTGINIVIEPKGYTVATIDLDFSTTPVLADFLVHPVGWTEENPNAVTSVDVVISPEGLSEFWLERFSARLDLYRPEILAVYDKYLLGLPAQAVDGEWSTNLVLPYIVEQDPSKGIFPGFEITHSISLGSEAVVTLGLRPTGDVIELIRPRMYSMTLYNVILDRFRERLFAAADFIEGMPKAEVESASDEIAEKIAQDLESSELARELRAYAAIDVVTLPDEPVVRIDATVESLLYDLSFETFVDFGNEARDSSEIQARLGLLLARGAEVFVNLNYFTNDNTLETDIALGFRPVRGTFSAIGYDLEREALKYFLEQELSPGFLLRGEIFEEDDLNEFGMTYQFQQYLSAGMYTNGNNEYWVRAIFTL